MKKLILLILLTCSFFRVNASDSIQSRSKFDSSSIMVDTLINKENDSLLLDIPSDVNEVSRVVVMNNNEDNLWVSVGLPIFTLLLGIAIPLVIDWLFKIQKSRIVLKRWVAELRCLESPIQKQIEANALVVTGILKGKNFTSVLKSLKELQPLAAQ